MEFLKYCQKDNDQILYFFVKINEDNQKMNIYVL